MRLTGQKEKNQRTNCSHDGRNFSLHIIISRPDVIFLYLRFHTFVLLFILARLSFQCIYTPASSTFLVG